MMHTKNYIENHGIAKENLRKYSEPVIITTYLIFPMLTQLEVKKSVTNTGVRVFSFQGELDETNVDSTFPNIINDIGDFSSARTLFHFGALNYLNSKSIGYIADIAQRTEDGNGKFAICELTNEVRDTLDLVGITNIIPIYETEEQALIELSK